MFLSWFRERRRRRLLAQPFPADWQPWLDRLPFYRALSAQQQDRLRDILRVLVAEKSWEGCGGLTLTEEMKVVIAAQAALLVVDRPVTDYPAVDAILVYPAAYVTHEQHDAFGIVRAGQVNLGEAWRGGPVVLAWDAVERGARHADDGRNLVFHEFAHKLDMRDGLADGTPVLDDAGALAEWVRVMSREFERLRDDAAHGRATVLDTYGATNPAEFFAVATECYFERAEALRKRHPELFAVMRGYYRPERVAESTP